MASAFEIAKQNAQKGRRLGNVENLPATVRDQVLAGDKAGRRK